MRARFSSSLHPPEPARVLMAHFLGAAADLAPLPPWFHRHPLSAMSASARQVVWAVGRRVTRNPDHGYAMAERIPVDAVGWLWQLYRTAPTLAALHASYRGFASLLLDSMTVDVEEQTDSVSLVHRQQPPVMSDRAEEDFRAAHQVNTWRALHDAPGLVPLAVHFTYERPRSTSWHERALGTSALRFAQPAFTLVLHRTWWEAPLPSADPDAFAAYLSRAQAEVRAHERHATELRVEGLVTELLSSGPTAPSVASLLGVSLRTLRRRLAGHGLGFRTLLERVQMRQASLFDEAEEQYALRALSRSERARLLGFANPGALRNAVRRWRSRPQG